MRQYEPYVIHGSHWRHLTNTTERSVYGGDAALTQLTSTICCITI